MTNKDVLKKIDSEFPILELHTPLDVVIGIYNIICESLDEARKKEAIEFSLFKKNYLAYRQDVSGTQYWICINGNSIMTTEQLYEKFKEEKDERNNS